MSSMMEMVTLNYWTWLGIALFLTILEVLLGGSLFLIWLAVPALFVAVLQWAMPNLSMGNQILVFSLVSMFSTLLWRQYLKRASQKSGKNDQNSLNQKAEQFIGKIYTLVDPIANGVGKIKIADSVWQVSGPELDRGTQVKVIGMDGTVIKVQPLI